MIFAKSSGDADTECEHQSLLRVGRQIRTSLIVVQKQSDLNWLEPNQRTQFFLSFIQFWVATITGARFIIFNQYSCLSAFIICSCYGIPDYTRLNVDQIGCYSIESISVAHAGYTMTSASPYVGYKFVLFAGLFGILLVFAYWTVFYYYQRYHIHWNFPSGTLEQSSRIIPSSRSYPIEKIFLDYFV